MICACSSKVYSHAIDGEHEKYSLPHTLSKKTLSGKKYIQPWNRYCPSVAVEGKEPLPCQAHNIKVQGVYDKIEVGSNKWVEMANDMALYGAKHHGGPFGAVAVQVDDSTGEVLRYWKGHNHVTQWCDPTAHAEIVVIREAAKDLKVFNLGKIKKSESKLPQKGEYSHIEIYSSAEPCPMCMSAIYWSHIPVLVFSSTRFDAAQQGLDFSDEALYSELKLDYNKRKLIKVYQATADNSLDAFNHWKRTPHVDY